MRKFKTLSIKWIFVGIIVIGVLLYLYIDSRPRNISSFIGEDLPKITGIHIMNGTTGEIVAVDDKEVIKKTADNLKTLTFTKHKDQSGRDGWSYWLSLYKNKDIQLKITFAGEDVCEINGLRYSVSPTTTLGILEDIYNAYAPSQD